MTMKRKIIIITIIAQCFIGSCWVSAQSKNWLSYDVGAGMSTGDDPLFINVSTVVVGYKRVIWKDRLRLQPALEFGSSWKGMKTDLRDEVTNSLRLKLSLDYDLIYYKKISLNVAAGGFVGYSRTLKGTGAEFNSAISSDIMFNVSEYSDAFNCGALLAAGIRIVPWNKECAFRITPLSLCVARNRLELRALIGLDVRLNGKEANTKK